MHWRERAACQLASTDIFMPGSENVERAKAICRVCEVSSRCLAYAISSGAQGIYGGTTDEERLPYLRPVSIADGAIRIQWTRFGEHPSQDPPDQK